jgi:hypothetical protein
LERNKRKMPDKRKTKTKRKKSRFNILLIGRGNGIKMYNTKKMNDIIEI